MKIPLALSFLALALLCPSIVGAQTQPTSPSTSAGDASSATAPAAAKIDPAKEEEIRKMLVLTGAAQRMKMVINQMLPSMKQTNPGIPEEFWDRAQKEMDAESQHLVDLIVPIYDKYYTLDDLKAVNAFYETPAGQRLLQNMPNVLHDSMQIGQEWGRTLGAKIVREIEDEKKSSSTSSTPSSPPSK